MSLLCLQMKGSIEKFLKVPRPKFVGVRHLISFEEEDYLTREEFIKVLREGFGVYKSEDDVILKSGNKENL